MNVLPALKAVGDQWGLGKKKDLRGAAAVLAWPLLRALRAVTQKQLAAEMKVQHLEEELKLERDTRLLQADNKRALRQQLQQESF